MVIPDTHHQAAQVVIASSEPVLAGALRSADLSTSLASLRRDVQVRSLTADVISISARRETAAEAAGTANAIADSYVAYLRTVNGPGAAHAAVLDPAVRATATPLPRRLLGTAGLCALLVVMVGARGALVIGRGRRRVSPRAMGGPAF